MRSPIGYEGVLQLIGKDIVSLNERIGGRGRDGIRYEGKILRGRKEGKKERGRKERKKEKKGEKEKKKRVRIKGKK